MKKCIIISVLLIFFLVMCWEIGRIWHRGESTDGTDAASSSNELASSESSGGQTDGNENTVLLDSAVFENALASSDNPWGVTAGVIETEEEGKCIFLTPNTAVSFCDIGLDEVAFAYRIHPWVQADSDGAGLVYFA